MLNLTLPVIIFGSVIACLIGSLIHLVAGGKILRLIFSMFFSWLGFWAGNYLANRFNIGFLQYGQVNYGGAILISLLAGLLGFWISGENRPESEQ